MLHFMEDGTMVLKAAHHIAADGSKVIALTMGAFSAMEGTCHIIRRRGYGTFLHFFRIPDRALVPDPEIIFGLDREMIDQLAKKTGLDFEPDVEAGGNVCFARAPEVRDDYKISFSPIDVLNYIHGLLYATAHSKKSGEFLKTDPPDLPYPKGSAAFWELAKLGREIS